ncbi:MAG: AAA family ATPase [Rubrivivax sp.]|nr:AAA family ATPase [Rubrivivax sp.]
MASDASPPVAIPASPAGRAGLASHPPLRIALLGDLAVVRGGRRMALPASRRTRALLGYLVATSAPQSRSALCDLLWDGSDDPRASLRWSLTKLRPVVDGEGGGPRLVADRERVAFEGGGCAVDTHVLAPLIEAGPALRHAPIAQLEAAAAALAGEFLDGLELPACYRFHHWCMAERERYGTLRRAVLQALTERLAGEPERALPHGHAMVAAEPLAEGAHATLVALLAAAGRYPEAERHYAWARDLLRREVAAPDGGPLDEAIRRVRRERREAAAAAAAALAATSAAASSSDPATPAAAHGEEPAFERTAAPLLGRQAELAAIAATLQAPHAAPLLLFTGEPGIGKTRLLEQFAADAGRAGRLVIRTRCFEAEMVRPYGMWLDALRALPTAGIDADTLARAAPLLAGRAGDSGDRARLFEAAAALLRAATARQPLALLLDDLQWIDEGSAALLHYLVRTLVGGAPAFDRAACFAGAARAGEVDDNPPARALLLSLAREGRLGTVPLAPLDAAEAGRLLAGVALDAEVAWRQSGGNPLYLLELARAAGRGEAAGGKAGHPGRPEGTVDALVAARVGALDAPTRELLGWAAAGAREVDPERLAEAAGVPVPEVLAALERLERRALVVSTGAGRFDFAHDIVRQTIYRGLSQARRRAIHRRFMRALLAAAAEDPALHGEVAHHAELAGEPLAAARAGLAAGEFCLRVFANVQAAAVAERALAQLDRLPAAPARVPLEVGLLRLRVAAAAGTGGARLPALAGRIEAAALAAEAQGLHAEASSAWEILSYWHHRASDVGATREATLAAERLAGRADARTRCLQLANTARCLLDIEADPARGRALLQAAAVLAGELALPVMELDWGRGLVARDEGRLDDAAAALARAVQLARAAGNHWREYECRVWLATVDYERRRFDDVHRHVEAIGEAAARMGEPPTPFALALAALARWHEGSAAGAPATHAGRDLALQLDALRRLDDKAHLAYALNEAAALALAARRHEEARRLAAEALAAAEAVRRPTEQAVARAWLAAAGRAAGIAANGEPPRAPPRMAPALSPSVSPSVSPSLSPSLSPSVSPSVSPPLSPSVLPSVSPSMPPELPPSARAAAAWATVPTLAQTPPA